jgi:hypothetical protein
VLPAGASFQTHMNIAFTSASQTVKLEVVTDRGTYSVSVKPQLGELLRPITLSEADFDSRQSTQLANHPARPPSRPRHLGGVMLNSLSLSLSLCVCVCVCARACVSVLQRSSEGCRSRRNT